MDLFLRKKRRFQGGRLVTMMWEQETLPSKLVRWNEFHLRKHRNEILFPATLTLKIHFSKNT